MLKLKIGGAAMPDSRFEVAIVGAGPVGLTLAALLSQAGVSVVVLERRGELHRLPQAHVVNCRTMEVFRSLGLDRKVFAAAAPIMRLRYISWCESLAGREFGRLSLMGSDPTAMIERLSFSPTNVVNLAQNVLEPILYDHLIALGGTVRFDHDVIAATADESGARLVVGNAGDQYALEADYLVACDGAGSGIRRGLGIEMIGPTSLQKFITIYFTANLDRHIGGRSGPLQWIVGPDVRGVLIGFDLAGTYALMCPYAEPNTPEEYDQEVAAALVSKAIGDPDVSFDITAISSWNMSAQIADRFSAGRIFLAGDAAHRFPPSGGLGMNTGVQDAHNLAWKLAAVIKGSAGFELLTTYEEERRPVVQVNCEQSVGNSVRLFQIDSVLGVATMAPVTPQAALQPASQAPDYGLDGDTPESVAKLRAVAETLLDHLEHFDSIGLDCGVHYETGALVRDGSDPLPIEVTRYVPSTRPGSRLPHVWLESQGRRTSTLDLVQHDGLVVIAGADGKGWPGCAAEVAAELGYPVVVHQIGATHSYTDPQDSWRRVGGPVGSGAILVRPDGHIGWRASVCDGRARASLRQACFAALGRPATAKAVA